METSVSRSEFQRSAERTNFIDSYAVAKQFVDDCVKAYYEFWELIRRCQNHIRGERPVPYSVLKKKGMEWVPNDNYLKATAKLQQLSAEQVDKVMKALMVCYPEFRKYDKNKDKGKITEFLKESSATTTIASAIGYAFYKMLRHDPRCSSFFNAIEYPATAFGVSYAQSYDDDWFPEIIHPLNIAVKPRCRTPESLPGWVIFHTMDADELWNIWDKVNSQKTTSEEDADGEKQEFTGTGWNLKALQEVLWRSYKTKDKNSLTTASQEWASALNDWNTCSSAVIQNTADISIAKIYYKETDGSLTITYIPYNESRDWTKPWQSVNPSDNVPGILYRKNIKNFVQEEKFNFIRDSGYSETTFIEDYRGIAKFAVLDSIRYNETRNDIRSKSRLAGSPFFDKGNSQVGETFKIAVGTGYCLLPDNFTLNPNQPTFDLQTGMAYLAFEENQYSRLTQQFDASAEGRLSSRPNKAEVQMISQEVNELNSSKDIVKFSDYRELFWQILRRLCQNKYTDKVAARGQNKFYECLEKQLPQFKRSELILILKCVSGLELTPIIADTQAIMAMMQSAETPFARNRYRRMWLLSMGAPIEEVEVSSPLISDKTLNFQEERIAQFENNDLANTSNVILSGSDDHIVHLNSHLALAIKLVEGWQQQQIEVGYAFKYLTNLMAHSMGHMELLMRDPLLNQKAQEFQLVINRLQQDKNKMQSAYDQQIEAQMQEQEKMRLDPVTAQELYIKQQEAAAKQQRTDQNTINKAQNNAASIELNHEQQMQRIENEREEKLLKLELDAAVKMNEP